jgi:peptidoglycan/LPS O-acetylase OafA/YrhL
MYGYQGNGRISSFYESLVSSILLFNSTACFQLGGAPLDGASWTVGTLAFFWLLFPSWAQGAKTLSTRQLHFRIAALYYLQVVLIAIVFFPLLLAAKLGLQASFAISTMTPWTRFPVFLMGVYAGECCLRHEDIAMSWPKSVLLLFPYVSDATPEEVFSLEDDQSYWGRVADVRSAFILWLTFCTIVSDGIYLLSMDGTVYGGLWLQAVVPYMQLTVVVALTRDASLSDASDFLQHPICQWLGDISYSLYLISYPVIFAVCLVHNAVTKDGHVAVTVPAHLHCKVKYDHKFIADQADPDYGHCSDAVKSYLQAITLPGLGIPAVIIISIPLAFVLHRLVEIPCRKALQSMR